MALNIKGVCNTTLGTFILICLTIFPSLVSATESTDSLYNLYHRARLQTDLVQTVHSALYTAIKRDRFSAPGLTLSFSTVTTINGMDDYLRYIRTFQQPTISDEPDFVLQHLQFLDTFQVALSWVQLDEEELGTQEGQSYTVYDGSIRGVILEVNRLRTTLRSIYDILHGSEYPGFIAGVTFDTCDLDCTTKRGLFIIQEFNCYIGLAAQNFASLHEAATPT